MINNSRSSENSLGSFRWWLEIFYLKINKFPLKLIIRDKQTLVDLSDTTKHSISIAARDFVSKLIKTINSKSRAIKLFQNVSRLYLKITKFN